MLGRHLLRRPSGRRFSAACWHPTVDVGGLLPGAVGTGRRQDALHQLQRALLNGGPGYFYAAGVDDALSAEYVQKTYAFMRRLHSLPSEVKRKFVANGGSSTAGASYSGSDVGHPELAYDPSTKATARSWDYSRIRRSSDGAFTPQYPDIEPGFHTILDDLYERQNVVGNALLTSFAEVMGLPSDAFARHFEVGDMGTIRLIHYPGDSDPSVADADVGIAPHTDFEAFTLMHQNAPGLQFMPRASSAGASQDMTSAWIDAPVKEAEFVVIIGDVLERFTNGVLRATPHRVVRAREPRMSIIRFNAVAPDTIIEPFDQFITPERPRAYTRCTMRQHMDTTIRNLELGLGSWDATAGVSRSATYHYED